MSLSKSAGKHRSLVFYNRVFLYFIVFFLILAGVKANANEISADNIIIDSVVIENGNIFDLSQPENSGILYRLANKFHIVTKKSVIERELLIREGDRFSREIADETERNLRALPYLWNARLSLDKSDEGDNILRVETSDRWTLAGGPSMSRVSGQTIYQIGFEELNFLGYGQHLTFDYFIREYKEDYATASFLERRLLGSRYQIYGYYNDDPEVGLKSVSLTRPLYSLNSRFGYGISFTDIDRQDKYHLSGIEVANNQYAGQVFSLSSTYRFGTYNSKVSFGAGYSYRDINIHDRRILPGVTVAFPSDSLCHGLSASLGITNLRYIKTRHINNFSKIEDFAISTGAGVGFGWIYDASSGDRMYRTVSFSVSHSAHYKSSLLFFSFSRGCWFDGETDFRKTFSVSIKYYNNGMDWLTPSIFGLYAEDDRRDGRLGLNLGENSGIRGFPEYHAQGERLARLNVENRIFTGLSLLTTEFGLVQFVDLGNVWRKGEEPRFKDILWSVGLGLRIGTDRVSNAELVRIDLAYAGNIKEWQISFGVGQYLL